MGIVEDNTPTRKVFDPNHPDANPDGYVEYPNVNVVTEMTDMLSATRSYEANVTVFNAVKAMAQRALEIGR
jgi:flagellar basal-body rod protein FlgC